jgi:hypothetical protein
MDLNGVLIVATFFLVAYGVRSVDKLHKKVDRLLGSKKDG